MTAPTGAEPVTTEPARVDDLEEIKRLKARYCRYLDTKQWAALRALFADDAVFDGFRSAPTGSGPDQFVAGGSSRLADAITVHQCHLPDIVFLDEDTARGTWAMHDYLEWPDRPGPDRGYYGYGYYEEEYRRVDGVWKMAVLRLRRQRAVPLSDDHPPLLDLPIGPTTDWLPS